MNPNAGEPDNQENTQGGIAAADRPNIVSPGLETPVQTPEETQFATQFGGVVPSVESLPTTPSVAESTPDLIDTALANLETQSSAAVNTSAPQPSIDNLAPEATQPVVETLTQPEPKQTPAEKLRQKISDDIDAFLEEVTIEKVAV